MLVTAIRNFCGQADFLFEPSGVEDDASTAEQIIKAGFLLRFRKEEDREQAISEAQSSGSVASYHPHNYVAPAAAPAPAPEPKPEPAAEPVKPADTPAAPAPTADTPAPGGSTNPSTGDSDNLVVMGLGLILGVAGMACLLPKKQTV